jgi:hypothetical protein
MLGRVCWTHMRDEIAPPPRGGPGAVASVRRSMLEVQGWVQSRATGAVRPGLGSRSRAEGNKKRHRSAGWSPVAFRPLGARWPGRLRKNATGPDRHPWRLVQSRLIRTRSADVLRAHIRCGAHGPRLTTENHLRVPPFTATPHSASPPSGAESVGDEDRGPIRACQWAIAVTTTFGVSPARRGWTR